MSFHFRDDDDETAAPTRRRPKKVHRALYGGGVLCESTVHDEHRPHLVTTYDDAAITCARCRRLRGA